MGLPATKPFTTRAARIRLVRKAVSWTLKKGRALLRPKDHMLGAMSRAAHAPAKY
jgi:hypothetical protein